MSSRVHIKSFVIWTLAISFLIPFSLIAQQDKISFVEYGVAEGLPEELVADVVQDDQGYMWFTTQNGLVKFDGYTMEVFRASANPDDTLSLRLRSLSRLIKGRDGKLWVGSRSDGGVASFDPVTGRFKNYLPDPDDPIGMPVSSHLAFEDLRGNIWFNQVGFKICRLDPETSKVHRYPYYSRGAINELFGNGDLAEVPGDSSIWSLEAGNLRVWNSDLDTFELVISAESFQNKYGMWDSITGMNPGVRNELHMASLHGAYRWDVRRREIIESYLSIPGKDTTICPTMLVAGFEATDGKILLSHWGGMITLIDPLYGTSKKLTYGTDIVVPEHLSSSIDWLFPTFENQNGVWFQALKNNKANAYVYYDYDMKVFRFYDTQFNDGRNRAAMTGSYFSLKFKEDKSGLLWLARRPGVFKQSPHRRRFDIFQHAVNNPSTIPSDTVTYLFEDSRQRLWIGTVRGLALYNRSTVSFRQFRHSKDDPGSISSNAITNVFEDSSGQIWVATNNGLNKLNEQSMTFDRYLVGAAQNRFNTGILLEDHLNRLWTSVLGEGVYVLGRNGQIIMSFLPNTADSSSLTSDRIRTMYQDSYGAIWLGDGSNSMQGLFRFNEAKGSFVHYRNVPNDSTSLINNELRYLVEDGQQRLWVGTDGGLHLYHRDQDHFKRYADVLLIPSVSGYARDLNGGLWFATYAGRGLTAIDISTDSIRQYGEGQGMLHNDVLRVNWAHELLTDSNGKIWLPTRRGLSVFDPDKKTFANFFESDGFQQTHSSCVTIQTSDGYIWLGGMTGLNRVNPADLMVVDSTLPDVWITKATIMGEDYSVPDGQIFSKAVSYTDEIHLKHWQKDLGFEFVALHYLEPSKNQYSWRLENYNEEWSTPSTVRTASFTNLSPGTYAFHVRGSNADGIWNEVGDSITIVIASPWWATIGFRSLMFILIAGSIWRYVSLRTNKTKREKARLEREVQKRTETIREQAAQLQELDEVKTRVYTNITHEFRTPLTVISGMTEMIEGHEHAKRLIRTNADQLLNLVNQLLELRKLRSGKLMLHPVCADVIPYMTYIFESFRSMADRKNQDIRFISHVESLEMDYDPEKLLRVVSNLLSNAIKYTPEGGEILVGGCIGK